MKKNIYIRPELRIAKFGTVQMMATSLNSDLMDFGGNASDDGVNEADVNRNGNWDLW